MVSDAQKVFEGVKVVIMMMEAAIILSSAKIQNVLEQWSWVLDFILSELRSDHSGEPVELQGEKKFYKKPVVCVLKTKLLNVLQGNFKTVFHYLTAFLLLVQLILA